MTKPEIYKRIFEIFKENPTGVTFRSLCEIWDRNVSKDDEEKENKKPLKKRSFQRYKDEIRKLYDVDIVCRREGEVYKYAIDGMSRVEVDSLLLQGGPIPQSRFSEDDITVRILVDRNACPWMSALLKDTYYETHEYNSGKMLFEFKADITDAFARTLLPYADSFEIKRPRELVDKVYYLVCNSRHKLLAYRK